MSEDVYVLKKAVKDIVLFKLNECILKGCLISYTLQESLNKYEVILPEDDDILDWIAALKSGKKIVNPMSPREDLYRHYEWLNPAGKRIIDDAIGIIAKEHPDVKDWLKEDDADA